LTVNLVTIKYGILKFTRIVLAEYEFFFFLKYVKKSVKKHEYTA